MSIIENIIITIEKKIELLYPSDVFADLVGDVAFPYRRRGNHMDNTVSGNDNLFNYLPVQVSNLT